jgi:hypothetical protein
MNYDQFVDFVSNNPGCVIGAAPITARAFQAAGFDMVTAIPFVEEGKLLALNLHLDPIIPYKAPSVDQFSWAKKFMKFSGLRRRRLG